MPGWMRASALEFRVRYWTHTLVFTLGLWSPWTSLFGPATQQVGANAHVWGVLSAYLAKLVLGPAQIILAFNIVLVAGIVFAVAGAFLRTWGAAYVGTRVVSSGAMHTSADDGILEDGPFRVMRNPLYLGTFLYAIALAMLMTVSGAVFTVVLIGLMQVRLVGGEERFLGEKLGPAYAEYCARVPRWLPRISGILRPTHRDGAAMHGAPGRSRPVWWRAFVAEIAFWGTAASYAVAGWRYNPMLLIECVVVSFGVSLVARAAVSPQAENVATDGTEKTDKSG